MTTDPNYKPFTFEQQNFSFECSLSPDKKILTITGTNNDFYVWSADVTVESLIPNNFWNREQCALKMYLRPKTLFRIIRDLKFYNKDLKQLTCIIATSPDVKILFNYSSGIPGYSFNMQLPTISLQKKEIDEITRLNMKVNKLEKIVQELQLSKSSTLTPAS